MVAALVWVVALLAVVPTAFGEDKREVRSADPDATGARPLMLDRQVTADCEQEILERAVAWQRRLAEDDA